jgi:hypothetical protein
LLAGTYPIVQMASPIGHIPDSLNDESMRHSALVTMAHLSDKSEETISLEDFVHKAILLRMETAAERARIMREDGIKPAPFVGGHRNRSSYR